MTPEQREAVRAAQPARLLSRLLVSLMSADEAEVYRSCRRTTRLSIVDSLRIAGRPDLIPSVAA